VASGCGISLPCLPYGNYYLFSQVEIDNFQTDYPQCSDLAEDLLIRGDDITNLVGLNLVTSIGGDLTIDSTNLLADLTGLNSLASIGGTFSMHDNDILNDLTGLYSVASVGGSLYIFSNDSLTSLIGLDSLHTIGGGIHIGKEEWYHLLGNPVLTSISGLANIDAGSIEELSILGNHSLSDCAINSICNYLISPNGYVAISDNAPGCNSPEEVEAACGIGVKEVGGRRPAVSGYPNPFSQATTIEYELEHDATVTLTLYNHLGQEVVMLVNKTEPAGTHQVQWDAEDLPAGIYFYRISTIDNRQSAIGKLVKY
jgi:hypothetical protein